MEAVLLTGGSSRRMGEDKAKIEIEGERMALRIVRALGESCDQVTVLGREPMEGCRFVRDETEHAGPLIALAGFKPEAEVIFLASCDLPRFSNRLPGFLASKLEGYDAVLPQIEGRIQPLCAAYAADSWKELRTVVAEGSRRIMDWTDRLRCQLVGEDEMRGYELDPRSFQGANSRAELDDLLRN